MLCTTFSNRNSQVEACSNFETIRQAFLLGRRSEASIPEHNTAAPSTRAKRLLDECLAKPIPLAMDDNKEGVKLLLASGADPNIKNEEGKTRTSAGVPAGPPHGAPTGPPTNLSLYPTSAFLRSALLGSSSLPHSQLGPQAHDWLPLRVYAPCPCVIGCPGRGSHARLAPAPVREACGSHSHRSGVVAAVPPPVPPPPGGSPTGGSPPARAERSTPPLPFPLA
eukprot:1180573-Prorocentrum_minimum.AAC.5